MLDGVQGAARVRRARWILALADLQREGRSWSTLREWLDAWPLDVQDEEREPEKVEATAKRQRHRLQEALRELALDLVIETPEGEGLRIHTGSDELRELVALEEREARVTVEAVEARRDRRAPEVVDEVVNGAQVVDDYRNKRRPHQWLSRRYGVSTRSLRKMLTADGRKLRPRGRTPIEHARPPELVARALRVFDAGGSVRGTGRILLCSQKTAQRFLDRHDRRSTVKLFVLERVKTLPDQTASCAVLAHDEAHARKLASEHFGTTETYSKEWLSPKACAVGIPNPGVPGIVLSA